MNCTSKLNNRFKLLSCFVFLLISFVCPGGALSLEIMQPLVYDRKDDVSDWLWSEKLDGVRGYWDGKQLLSKNGLPFHPHPDFVTNFPEFPLEGEIWGGRQTFEQTISIVKKNKPHDGWLNLKFAVFDVPQASGGFEQRLQLAQTWFAKFPSSYAFVIEHKPVRDHEHLAVELKKIARLGGEGIILRKPGSLYQPGRSSSCLKVKSYDDMEAVVIAHVPGKGRNKGRLGSLLVELPQSEIRFKIGSGLSDEVRNNPPEIGAVITFKFYGFYQSGIPKFPSFLRVRQ